MTGFPILQTERLTLRAPNAEQFEDVAAFLATDRSKGVGGPKSRYEAWSSFAAQIGHWQMRGYGMFAIFMRDTGHFCGFAGPYNPEGWIAPEIGWWITDPAAEGQGIAFEAATAARAHTYAHVGWTEAFSVIIPGNTRSIALAERLGATLDREDTTPRGFKVLVYRHPGPEVLQ